ncbi:6423_t:CDS:1, partial [Funneliformis geosporum]
TTAVAQFILTRTFYRNYDLSIDLIYVTKLAEIDFRVRVSLIVIIGSAKFEKREEIVII